MTSFLYYIQRCQKDFKAANPNLVHKEAIAKMGAEWQKMSDKDKKPFNDLSAIDKARYEKEKQEYQNTLKKGAVVKKKETPVKSTVDKKTKV